MNPYDTHRLWPPATLEAWQSMPVNASGHILEPVEMHRSIWREWMKKTDKSLWYPPVIRAYELLDRAKR